MAIAPNYYSDCTDGVLENELPNTTVQTADAQSAGQCVLQKTSTTWAWEDGGGEESWEEIDEDCWDVYLVRTTWGYNGSYYYAISQDWYYQYTTCEPIED
jgi:hypothetical protein